jgi:predicted transcriptional regulator
LDVGATRTCDNPRCTCTPCLCEDCKCNPSKLGHLEERVMDVVWQAAGEVRARQVAAVMPDYAPTTIATVLRRLADKGLVRRRVEGRALWYGATGNAAGHVATVMVEALRSGEQPDRALDSFVAALSDPERHALQDALRARGRTARSPRVDRGGLLEER